MGVHELVAEAPRYEHTCPLCTYLGWHVWHRRGFDLYACRRGHMGRPTILARGSSDPHDIASGIALAQVDPVMREALERALAQGALTEADLHDHGGAW